MSNKKTILEFFHNLPKNGAEQFNKAFELYKASSGKSTATERTLNAGGFTKHNLDVLLYELQKIHGITDLEKRPPKVKTEEIVDQEPEVVLPVDTGSDTGTTNGNPNQQDSQDTKPEPAPEQPAFREEYPFLKDPECPGELKILATDKITYYNAYQDAHNKLQQATNGEFQLSDDEKLALANEAEENFAKNEAIKAELDHYRDQGEILGLHPLFKKLQAEREVADMSNDALHKFVTSTKTYVSRKNKDIKEAQSEDKKAELQQELDERLYKLSLVKKKLGLEDK